MEYDDRMLELEKVEYPKPKREFVYNTYNLFADRHPWVGQENIRPKSIVREMFEQFRTFADYIKVYDLQRSEGLLLRHISSVHKVMAHTIPDAAKTEQVREMEVFLSQMIRQVDSSLIEEWERMRDPNYQIKAEQKEVRPPGAEEADKDVTRDKRAFTAEIRNRIFTFLRACVNQDYELALETLSTREPWDAKKLEEAVEAYYAAHSQLRLDPEARNTRHTYVVPEDGNLKWKVQQMLIDREEHNDWVAEFEVDITRSRESQEPHLTLIQLQALSERAFRREGEE
jgi:hypothetical protein